MNHDRIVSAPTPSARTAQLSIWLVAALLATGCSGGGVSHAGVGSADVANPDSVASEVAAADAAAVDTAKTDISAPDAQVPDVQADDIQAVDVQAVDVQAADVQAVDVEQADLKPGCTQDADCAVAAPCLVGDDARGMFALPRLDALAGKRELNIIDVARFGGDLRLIARTV